MQQSAKANAANKSKSSTPTRLNKALAKSKNAINEINSYQNKRHNFIGKQMEANDGAMPMLDENDYQGRSPDRPSRSNSTINDRSRNSISTHNRSVENQGGGTQQPVNIDVPNN